MQLVPLTQSVALLDAQQLDCQFVLPPVAATVPPEGQHVPLEEYFPEAHGAVHVVEHELDRLLV